MRLIDADALEKLHCEDCSAEARGMCEADPICASLMWVREAPAIDAVEVKTLEAWLYGIAMYNTNTYLCDACEEIISRLDGLRVFAKERRDDDAAD